jgi:hypothetical protein
LLLLPILQIEKLGLTKLDGLFKFLLNFRLQFYQSGENSGGNLGWVVVGTEQVHYQDSNSNPKIRLGPETGRKSQSDELNCVP